MTRTLALVALLAAAALARAAEPVTVSADPLRQLVLDSRVVDRAEGLRLVLGTIQKHPRDPLIKPDKPWENFYTNCYPNVIYDADEKLYKIWYRNNIVDKTIQAGFVPPLHARAEAGFTLCYATSADGIRWTKPSLGVVEFEGSTANNIVARDVHNVGVFKDAHDPDPDPARRYKMTAMDIDDMSLFLVRFSPDGVHWSEPVKCPSLAQGVPAQKADTHNNAFFDDRLGRYVLFTRWNEGRREIARSQSADFVHWEPSTLVLKPTDAEGKDIQAYAMEVFRYGNVYLGWLMMYHATGDRAVDCELAWSPDSVEWHRVAPGTPFIPRGPKGKFDAGCIYASSNPPLLKDGLLHIYYSGSVLVHRGWNRSCLPSLAILRVDGFAGYEPAPGSAAGTLVTKPMVCANGSLQVSADVPSGGSVLVTVLDDTGRELAASEPVTADVTDAPVKWTGGFNPADLAGKTLRLKFTLHAARLYAFRGLTLPTP